MERKIFNITVNKWLLASIVLIGVFFRFFNYPNRISMGLDSARDAFVTFEGARTLQFPLTGPFTSIAPLTTGPWYWIQLILSKLVLQTYYAPWILLGFYSTLMIIVMYKIGFYLRGKELGLLVAMLTALSPNQIANSVGLTNPAVIGFYSSLIFLLLLVILKKNSSNSMGFILGVVMGITINTHYQSISLLSLLVALMVYGKKYIKLFPVIFLGLIITFIPSVFFELNNHWFNTRGLMNYLLIEQYKIVTPMSWKIYISDFWPNFITYVLGGDKIFGYFVMFSISGIFLIRIFKKDLEKFEMILLLSFLFEVILIRYYRGERYFGYLQFFHPYLFYFFSYILYFLFKERKLRIAGLLIYTFSLTKILPSTIAVLTPEPLTVDTNRFVREFKSDFGSGPYSLYRCQNLLKPEVNAILLTLVMNKIYADEGKPLVYYWGCQYPDLVIDGKLLKAEVNKVENTNFPGKDRLRDASQATEKALASFGWKKTKPSQAYQSAARWWMDEQP